MILRSLHKRVTLACREKRKESLDSDQTSSLINKKRKKFAEIKSKTLLAEKIENIFHKQTNKQASKQAKKKNCPDWSIFSKHCRCVVKYCP